MFLNGNDLKLAEALKAELEAVRKPEGAGISTAVVIGGELAASCTVLRKMLSLLQVVPEM